MQTEVNVNGEHKEVGWQFLNSTWETIQYSTGENKSCSRQALAQLHS